MSSVCGGGDGEEEVVWVEMAGRGVERRVQTDGDHGQRFEQRASAKGAAPGKDIDQQRRLANAA